MRIVPYRSAANDYLKERASIGPGVERRKRLKADTKPTIPTCLTIQGRYEHTEHVLTLACEKC